MNRNVPVELLVYDVPEPCPYLPEQEARMPLRIPVQQLSGVQFDHYLETGQRRSGVYLYRPECGSCRACEPIRLAVERFHPNRTQRRILRRGDRLLHMQSGPPIADLTRVDLFNAHRRERGLAAREGDITVDEYEAFLVETCCHTIELSYRWDGRLIAVAICDVGDCAISAVYTYFDPFAGHLSPGVYSILKQVELCRSLQKPHLYLGYFVDGCVHMAYKVNYLPHERLIDGQWWTFEKSPNGTNGIIGSPDTRGPT